MFDRETAKPSAVSEKLGDTRLKNEEEFAARMHCRVLVRAGQQMVERLPELAPPPDITNPKVERALVQVEIDREWIDRPLKRSAFSFQNRTIRRLW